MHRSLEMTFMVSKDKILTYARAIFVTVIWSITFISTKVLLQYLSPTEVLFYRYIIAYLVFIAVSPKPVIPHSLRGEIPFFLCGLLGVTLYFLFENCALLYSTASNVSLLVSSAPMLTGVVAHFLTKNEKMDRRFAVACIFGLSGVFLIVFNGHFVLHLNPLGDMLAVLAALSFAFYSIIIKSASKADYSAIQITRKTFFYSLVTLVPLLFTDAFAWKPEVLVKPEVIGHLVFLGVLASSVCFLLWNKVIWSLGAVKANNLIYLTPPMTMVFASIMLHEKITVCAVAGGALILAGVCISQREKKKV